VTPKSFDEEVAYSGTLSATDADSTSFTFALLDDPSGLFQIQNTNQLVLLQPVDFESLPAGFVDQGNGTATVDLTLEVQDESGNPFSEVVTLTVNDVAEGGQEPTDPITLIATAGVLDGTVSPQQWGVDVTIAALTANGSAAVITHSTDGFGVEGGRFDTQIDHIPSSNTSEQFTLEFNDAVSDVILRFGRMNPDEGETGAWTAFDAGGGKVASGVLDPASGAKIATWTYDIPIDAAGQSFTELLLTATGYNGGVSGAPSGDSSDFAIKELTYTPDQSDGESLALENDDSMVDSLLIA
jgi:hypothetical protein